MQKGYTLAEFLIVVTMTITLLVIGFQYLEKFVYSL